MSVSAAAALCAFAHPALASDEVEQQDFLFRLDEAYTQEEGEFQVSLAFDQSFDPSASLFALEAEYGVTDRLQVSAEAPYRASAEGDGAGDLEVAVDYALLKDEGAAAPELTVGLAAIAPVGDEDSGLSGGWGYETSIRMSKRIASGHYLHATAAREKNDGAGDGGEREWVFGAGLAVQPAERITLLGEFLHEREREWEDDEIEQDRRSFLSAGIAMALSEQLIVGAGTAFQLDEKGVRFLAKIQTEW